MIWSLVYRTILQGFVLLIPFSMVEAQLTISEFMAESDGSLLDGDGDRSDWIEIQNGSGETLSTGGLYLTDDEENRTKWPLPEVTIPAGGHLLVFASGKDRRDPNEELHTNFSLSASGEYLAIIGQDGVTPLSHFTPTYPKQFFGVAYGTGTGVASEATTFIPWPANGTWYAPLEEMGDAWKSIGFDDSSWNQSQTGIGYGYYFPEFIGAGGDTSEAMRSKATSAYLRIPFQIDDVTEVMSMNLEVHVEDGFAAYLNGELVASFNVPDPLRFDSLSIDRGEVREGDPMKVFPINFSGKLQSGENVLAFQLVNDHVGSSDVLLIPRLVGEVRDGSGEMLGGYLASPTPGEANAEIEFLDYVRDTSFDIDRGFFEAPFVVTVSSTTPGATLVYTTDGSTPSLSNGTLVAAQNSESSPEAIIDITKTTVLRASAYRAGLRPANVDTQTYLFLDDVLDQPAQPEGYPLPWRSRNGSAIPGDFEMDPDVVGTIYSREELKESLRDIPTISIVTDIANLFNQQTGIQVNPQDSGPGSERRVSVEMLDFEDGSPLQLDAGMLMNGNASRNPNRGKHNFRLAFRNQYGDGKLNFPLFGKKAPTENFNQIILRGGNGNSWVHPTSAVRQFGMYIRDQWFRDAHVEMGYPEALQREVHVYINGLYFGVHHLFERIEEEWASERFGGKDDDWEGFRIVGGNNIEVIHGTPAEVSARMLDSWRAVIDAAAAGDLEAVEQYIDLDDFIDYLVLNFHAGNTDWDQNNVRAMRRVNPPGKFQFFCHDAERAGLNGLSTGNLNINSITHPRSGAEHRPTSVNLLLKNHPEYVMQFADRIRKHLFHGGALTPENGRAQWEARADGIRLALKAESAKWGDHADSVPRTLVDFQNGLDREYKSWFPLRTPISISQFRAAGLYPSIEPPEFNQHGGNISEGFVLVINGENGETYYTADGSDPRLPGGGINPLASPVTGDVSERTLIEAGASGWHYLDDGSAQTDAWKEPSFDDSDWSQGTAPFGFGSINGYSFGGPAINAGRHLTVYFRKEIQVADVDLITRATAKVMSDGGAIVYLNGVEIARDNMPDGLVDSQTTALSDSNVTEGYVDEFGFPPNVFVEGTNVFAVEVHNGSLNSSDMGMDLQIDLSAFNSINDVVALSDVTTVKARSFDGSEWSALTEATFIKAVAASPENLMISELFYNTATGSEFLELINISDEPVSLAGVAFEQGIDFKFSQEAILAPGARLILVSDLAAFQAVYGVNLPVFGEYSGRLDNSGEALLLTRADGLIIQEFRYNDRAPWPEKADGEGYSLTLIAPSMNPPLSDPASWRSSLTPGGTPGSSDALTFEGTTADQLLEYALVDPFKGITTSIQEFELEGVIQPYMVAEVITRAASDDAIVSVEFSQDLKDWQSGIAVYLGSNEEDQELTRRFWRTPEPTTSPSSSRYARIVVRSRF